MPTSPARFGPYRVTGRTFVRPERPAFEPEYRLTAAVFEALRAIERADHELRRYSLDAVEARRLLEDALTRNAYGTASIEGNPLSLEDVQSLLARGPTPEALARPEEREILNYAAFMQTLPDRRPPRRLDDLRSLHGTLFEGVLHDAGRFKNRPNFVGTKPAYEVTFIPAEPARVAKELGNALKWLRGADEHPLVRTILFFHEFESIHPFRDGNGRAGRALTTMLLHGFGYPGVRYALVDYEFNRDRDAYYAALAAAEQPRFEYTGWVQYMSAILRRTFEGAVERFAFTRELPRTWNDRQRRLALWFRRLASEAPRRQVKFADVHAAHPSLTERTLKRDLSMLRDAAVLDVEGKRKGTRYRLAGEPREKGKDNRPGSPAGGKRARPRA